MHKNNICLFKYCGVSGVEREGAWIKRRGNTNNLFSWMTVNAISKPLLACRLCERKKPVMSLVCAPEQSNGYLVVTVAGYWGSSWMGSYCGKFYLRDMLFLAVGLGLCSVNCVICLDFLFAVWQPQCPLGWLNLFWWIQIKRQFLTLQHQADHLLDSINLYFDKYLSQIDSHNSRSWLHKLKQRFTG